MRRQVYAVHTLDEVALDAIVGTLNGPFTINVTDHSNGSVVFTTKKQLKRADRSFATAIPLKPGTYNITIASDDSSETAEKVTFGPWTFNLANELRPNDFNKSANGKLSAYVTRVNGSGQLKVHIANDLDGFKLKGVDEDDHEIDSRTFSDLPRGANDWSLIVKVLFIAPLAKGGVMTVTGDRETAEAAQLGQDDIFNFYSFGAMLGHFRLHARRKRNEFGGYQYYKTGQPIYEANPNIAPELISWLTLSMGRWENFEIEVPTGEKDAQGNDITVRERPWRYEALGRLKIPETPFIIGFDGNFGKGPDDLRFLFGMRFDIGKVMRTLKLADNATSKFTIGSSS